MKRYLPFVGSGPSTHAHAVTTPRPGAPQTAGKSAPAGGPVGRAFGIPVRTELKAGSIVLPPARAKH